MTNADTRALKNAIRVCYAIVGMFAVLRGVGYLPTTAPASLPSGVEVITEHVPVTVWAILWLASAGCCFACVIRPRMWGIYGVIGMCCLWGLGYLFASLTGTPSAFLSVSTYFLFAGLVIAGSFIATRGLRLARLARRIAEDSTRGDN